MDNFLLVPKACIGLNNPGCGALFGGSSSNEKTVDKYSIISYNIGTVNDTEQQMEYLKRAERYAEARGDDNNFREVYTILRESNSVEESVWKALQYLYDGYVADMLEFQ
jgi:hypothetical protein